MKNKIIAGTVILAGIVGAVVLSGDGSNSGSNSFQFLDNTDTGTQAPPLNKDNDYSTERSYEEYADRDCGDFSSQAEAQEFFEDEGGPSSDYHGLDRDKDGIACESI